MNEGVEQDFGSVRRLVAQTHVTESQVRLAVAYRDEYPDEVAEAIEENRRPLPELRASICTISHTSSPDPITHARRAVSSPRKPIPGKRRVRAVSYANASTTALLDRFVRLASADTRFVGRARGPFAPRPSVDSARGEPSDP